MCLLDKMHVLVNRRIFSQETWGVYKYRDSSFIVMLHNFILSVCVGDSQFNDITIHNKDLTQSGLSLWVSEIKLETKREGLFLGMEIWVYLF